MQNITAKLSYSCIYLARRAERVSCGKKEKHFK